MFILYDFVLFLWLLLKTRGGRPGSRVGWGAKPETRRSLVRIPAGAWMFVDFRDLTANEHETGRGH